MRAGVCGEGGEKSSGKIFRLVWHLCSLQVSAIATKLFIAVLKDALQCFLLTLALNILSFSDNCKNSDHIWNLIFPLVQHHCENSVRFFS